MNRAGVLSVPRLWAAAFLVTALLLAADVLLGRGFAAAPRGAAATPAAPLPAVLRRHLRRLGPPFPLVLAALVTAVLDAVLAPPSQRFPRGGQAAALAAVTASVALLAPVSYRPGLGFLFLVALVALLRRIRGRTS